MTRMADHPVDTPAPVFQVGDSVTVKAGPADDHCRTPTYLRGARGQVVSLVGRYHNPSMLALHKPGLPKIWLYRVRFVQTDLWKNYPGASGDTVVADLYEHWLIPAQEHSNVTP